MLKRGMLVVVSGPSGVGKDTVIGEYLKSSDSCVLSVSATTRAIRMGEEHGKDYYYLERKNFMKKAQNGHMLEWAEYNGNFYGTPRDVVERERDAGRNVILIIEVQGAMNVRKLCHEAVLVFIAPPSMGILRERLTKRASDDADTIERRLDIAHREMKKAKLYDYILINQDYRICAADFGTVIRAASFSPKHTGLLTQL